MKEEPLSVAHAREIRDRLQQEVASLQMKIAQAETSARKLVFQHEREKVVSELKEVKQWIKDHPEYSSALIRSCVDRFHDLLMSIESLEKENERLKAENRDLKIRVSEIAF